MHSNKYTREEFLQSITRAALGTVGGLSLLGATTDRYSSQGPSKIEIPEGAVILFQGDSITDAGRNRDEGSANTASGLGNGYACRVSSGLLADYPSKNLRCYNRGISGDKVFQLAERWEKDCLDLKPDILSILVGVNDFWHTLDFNYEGNAETYEKDYRALLKRTRELLPDVTLMIGEPFALEGGSAINDAWYPDFPKYQKVSKQIAEDFKAAFIPYQSIFDQASGQVPATYWSEDGVHPTLAGSQLMANAWIETLKRL